MLAITPLMQFYLYIFQYNTDWNGVISVSRCQSKVGLLQLKLYIDKIMFLLWLQI